MIEMMNKQKLTNNKLLLLLVNQRHVILAPPWADTRLLCGEQTPLVLEWLSGCLAVDGVKLQVSKTDFPFRIGRRHFRSAAGPCLRALHVSSEGYKCRREHVVNLQVPTASLPTLPVRRA